MSQPIYQVDAFTKERFKGNPAGVCVLEEPREEAWMQAVAAEMNVAETAFLRQQEDGFSLRWFTPTVEVDLCGHATLASAHILWEIGQLPSERQARFFTKSGLLTAERRGDWIELNFPAVPPEPIEAPNGLLDALGVSPVYVGRNKFDYLVEVEAENLLRQIQPDFAQLAALPVRGVIVTSRSFTAPYDFISRFFAPAVGVVEDPVTGSAHCCLAPYWQAKLGKSEFFAYQASKRGGEVRTRVENERVILGGQAITTLRGELV